MAAIGRGCGAIKDSYKYQSNGSGQKTYRKDAKIAKKTFGLVFAIFAPLR
jgi:hypothetical protein